MLAKVRDLKAVLDKANLIVNLTWKAPADIDKQDIKVGFYNHQFTVKFICGFYTMSVKMFVYTF